MTNLAYDGARVPPDALATRLRVAREWRGIEQQQIADELGISRATVSNYENGHTVPRKLVLNGWAAYCDVDVEWLKEGWARRGSNPRPADYTGVGSAGNRITFAEDWVAPIADIDDARSIREAVPA